MPEVLERTLAPRGRTADVQGTVASFADLLLPARAALLPPHACARARRSR
jgi:hypothetical protein